ncbi:MAG: hypothetical protein RLZZ536_3270 [Planctomycetota bacterium]
MGVTIVVTAQALSGPWDRYNACVGTSQGKQGDRKQDRRKAAVKLVEQCVWRN